MHGAVQGKVVYEKALPRCNRQFITRPCRPFFEAPLKSHFFRTRDVETLGYFHILALDEKTLDQTGHGKARIQGLL
jgi:hypothetical protein